MSNQEQKPAVPVSGVGAVLSIVQAVTGLVPRWLVAAAGVVFLAWLSLDIYLNLQIRTLDLQAKEVETQAKTMRAFDARAIREKRDADSRAEQQELQNKLDALENRQQELYDRIRARRERGNQ